jgi:hypothetical protein
VIEARETPTVLRSDIVRFLRRSRETLATVNGYHRGLLAACLTGARPPEGWRSMTVVQGAFVSVAPEELEESPPVIAIIRSTT